ncbi:MAG TPA: UDP-N-acetylmuramyl-tripeptide synthetase [Patescibacteria group bacterium]|nr:UDP-N-acetylmuramyl-tripeptide synthetase [Patescibacteria group bacterium]
MLVRRIKNIAHGVEAELANAIYGFGRKQIPTIGVTGTDGKTTTTSLIFHILKTAGFNPAMVTTVGAQIGDTTYETGLHTTTPSPFALQKYIKKASDANCDYLVLEVTSHSLDQNRTRGVDFKIGVLTNITHEHLDYHGTYEKYARTKGRLFKRSDISLINKDDDSYKLLKPLLSNRNVLTYSIKGPADYTSKSVGIKFPGEYDFNYENFLAAVSTAEILGIKKEMVQKALETFKFPKGRQEIVYDRDFRVIIDFAHTPNSFERILPTLKKNTKGRLIHIFGAASKRDATKRPLMGHASASHSDIIILTAEDSRNEKVLDINTQIKLGITGFEEIDTEEAIQKNKKLLFEISDRARAIEFAVSIAQTGDTVAITGKGHEQSMNLGHGEIPWSDHEAVEKAIKLKLTS